MRHKAKAALTHAKRLLGYPPIMKCILRVFVLSMAAALLGGCATGAAIVTGKVRPPISPEQVRMYSSPPPVYEEVALVSANSYWSWGWNEQAKLDTANREIRAKAANLGANGVLIRNIGTAPTSIGGISDGGYSGGSITNMTTLDGIAIFVPGQPE